MGIKRCEHAINCGFDQFAIIHFFDVAGAYPLKDVPEEIQLLVNAGVVVRLLRKLWPCDLRGHQQSKYSAAGCGQKHLLHHQSLSHLARFTRRLRGQSAPVCTQDKGFA
mgnify:CR=1 FL=1